MANQKNPRISLNSPAVIIFTQLLILILLGFFIICYFAYDWQAEILIFPTCVFLISLFIWYIWSWQKVAQSLFDPYVVFLTAAILFNGGKAILEVFKLNQYGINNFGDSLGRIIFSFSSPLIMQMLLLVTLGLTSFHFGALLAARKKDNSAKRSLLSKNIFPTIRSIRLAGWALVLFSLVPTIFLLKEAVNIVLSSGYIGLFQRQVPTGFGATPRVLASFLVPGAFFLLASSKRHSLDTLVSAIVIVSYSTTQFFLGARAWAVMPLIAYAWLWHRRIRPLPKTILISAAILILFVVFPLIRVIRDNAGSDRFSASLLKDRYFSINNPAVETISEMGGSMQTVAHTLQFVPNERGFDRGTGYLYSLLTIFPNFFWDIHPTIARGSAAQWLVSRISPKTADEGGGYGFSFIAEAYLNFGWVGSAFFLAIAGFLIARFVLWAQNSKDPARLATVSSFFAFFLIFARGESSSVIRPLVWYAFFPYLLACVLALYLRKTRYEPRHLT